jgi:hypothetical protein
MANDVVPIPRTLETPPRTTGDPQLDLPLLVDWFYRAYQVITESVKYINGGSISKGDKISLLDNDSGYIGLTYYELESELLKFKSIIRGQDPSAASDLTTKNYVDAIVSSSGHAPVTVTDTSEIDLTLSGQDIAASIKTGSIAADKLATAVTTNLTLAVTAMQPGDALNDLNLNAGGTPIYGSAAAGGDLNLRSTSNATKGGIFIGDTLKIDDLAECLGIGTVPAGNSPLHISGLPTSSAGLSAGEIWNDSGTLKIA